MKITNRLFATLVFYALSCNTSAQEPPTTPQPGVDTMQTVPALPPGISAPPAGMGQIVFFRKLNSGAPAVRFKVRENEQELGKLSRGTYFVVHVTPGRHTYVVRSEAKDFMDLTVNTGETRYVLGEVEIGMFVGRPTLRPATAEEFDAVVSRLERTN